MKLDLTLTKAQVGPVVDALGAVGVVLYVKSTADPLRASLVLVQRDTWLITIRFDGAAEEPLVTQVTTKYPGAIQVNSVVVS